MKYLRLESGRSLKVIYRKSPAVAQRRGAHKSLAGANRFAKRGLDIGLSLAGLIILSPLLVLIAAVVKLSDGGSVLYRQVRVGLRGRRFTIIKFRSMSEDAESQLGAIWSVLGDPRCTSVGRFLRRSGFDELPQLWNVLRGDMSLVRPRPERPELIVEFRKEHGSYDRRHDVQCGITGYAQIHGWRGFTSLEKRLRHDLYYIRHWSLALDLKVLLLTMIHGWSERTRCGV